MDTTEAAERIRKVLALTASSNEHEAALAALRVQQLLAQHHLTLDEVQANELGETIFEAKGAWADTLLGIVAKACSCTTVTLIPKGRDQVATISLIGTTFDRATARDMYERLSIVLAARVDEAWAEHVRSLTDPQLGVHPAITEDGAEAEWKESFVAGALGRLHAQIATPTAHRFCARPECGLTLEALVPVVEVRQAAIERAMDFARKRFGELRTQRSKRSTTLLPSAVKQGSQERLT